MEQENYSALGSPGLPGHPGYVGSPVGNTGPGPGYIPHHHSTAEESKSCFWCHKWDKWKQTTEHRIAIRDGQQIPYVQDIQIRYCSRCNKMQKEAI